MKTEAEVAKRNPKDFVKKKREISPTIIIKGKRAEQAGFPDPHQQTMNKEGELSQE